MGETQTVTLDFSVQQEAARYLVMGLAGCALSDEETAFLRARQPAGVILFSRNIADLDQVQALIASVQDACDIPPVVWIDQEGGRVQRLRDPLTPYPSAQAFEVQFDDDPEQALSLARLTGWLNGVELGHMGIGVNCAPVLDIRQAGASDVIGERAFGSDPDVVAALAGAWLGGFTSTGLLAAGKHFPGHGAALVDSHKELPRVEKSAEELAEWEFVPYLSLLGQLPIIMTAHLVMSGLDRAQPATWSRETLTGLLREQWEYDGLIVSDALEMQALEGDMADRARRAVAAGCDQVLVCTGQLADAEAALDGVEQALAGLSQAERDANLARQEHILHNARIAPGPWRDLLQDATYRAARERVSLLAGEALALDPTEALSEPG
ncbi:beta-N-acetylhexosaminidase [Magnetofaba australis]|uniref:beta-N-acetylhexosaminidase n=1 Tax=Magnetofaba australis IT-1 TaxID=1434232 RepID=A0A1Y2K4L5_9PROT|nr:beta-N-acetylhexosaminidase [Magnetofaba australis]OSM04327.1 putative beta-N-acetylhexosaminidase [Magnetofaba australis IT-1]